MDHTSAYRIEAISENTVDEATKVRLQSWLDTYVNEELGVTREWILERNKDQLSDTNRMRRRKRLKDSNSAGWVALDAAGKVVGVTTPYKDNEGNQHVGSLYVAKDWHGTGVAHALMAKVLEWFDTSKPIHLGVVSYNERAKAFYRKWGFVEVPNSETLFDGKIPEIAMIRMPE